MLPEIIQRQKFFSLLHNIDVDLAEGVRSLGCPTVGDRYTDAPMCANLVAAPPTCPAIEMANGSLGISTRGVRAPNR